MNRTLRNVFYVSAADVLVKVVSASATFIVARLLTPAEYGQWVTLILIVSYAPIVALGTMETLVKQYPFYVGKGESGLATTIEEGALGSVIVASGVLLVGGLLVSVLMTGHIAPAPLRLVRVTLLTASASLLSAFFYYRFSAHQEFRFVSVIDFARAVITAGCLIGLTSVWGLTGTVAGFLVAELSICALAGWLSATKSGKIIPSFRPGLIWNMVTIGFPITVIWWVFYVQISTDRWISISILGESATGYYGLGVSIVSLLILLPIALSKVLYPRVNEKIGETSREQALRALVVIPSHVLSVVIPAGIGVLVFASPVLYRELLPKYGPGLMSAQILLLGSFFVCIVRTGANFLIATNRQHTVLAYVLVSLAVNVVGNVLLARSGFGIEGIAFGSSVSACLLATLVWLAVFKHMGSGRATRIKDIAGLYLPYALMLCLLAACAVLEPRVFAESSPRLLVLGGMFVLVFFLMMYAVPTIRGQSMEVLDLLEAHIRTKETR